MTMTPHQTDSNDIGLSGTRDISQALLTEASETIAPTGGRGKDYGDPLENFTRIADLWAPILNLSHITPAQVALCMAQVKVSRLLETPDHYDSWLDGAAYMALGAGVARAWAKTA